MTTFQLAKTGFLTVVIILSSFFAKSQLHADFSATPLSGCSPVVVRFTDLSTGNPTQWKWDLGNGTVSFLQNPSVTYFNPGQYTIKLVIQNSNGRDSVIRQQYIQVYDQPTVGFSSSVQSGCYPLPVQFNDQSTVPGGTITQWQWDFGDGQNSTLQNPVHVYTASGNYNVSLRVLSNNGCAKTITQLQYIQIHSGVTAGFTHSNPNSCLPPVNINFQNTSSGSGALTYVWDFGDGTTSTVDNPSHLYNSPGRYTVTLVAINNSGCRDTLIRTNTINIGAINTNFTNSTPVCANTPVFFTNISTPAPVSVLWSFGDGTTSTVIHPTVTYSSPGTYQVKLVNNFGNCKDSVTRQVTVLPKPGASFTASPVLTCRKPTIVNFTNNSTSANTYQWIFGDGATSTAANPTHTYDSAGSFTVTLIATNSSGCSDTMTRTDYVNIQLPQAQILDLPQEGCAPLSNTFSSATTSIEPVTNYLWDFGDGTTSTDSTPTHIFGEGIFNITLVVTTASGCTDTAIAVQGIRAGHRPVPLFFVDPLDACARVPINFTDSTSGMPDRWEWSFGDGGTSTMQNPSHHYQDTGLFTIKLIVWNNGCADSLEIPDLVRINPPIARFNSNFDCAAPLVREFTDFSIGADSWSWDFGDGGTSTVPNPVHTYGSSGIYSVMLIVFNNGTGCNDTTTRQVQVIDENANFTADQTSVCRRSMVTFTSGANSLNILSYEWNFGDGTTGWGNPVSHTYSATGVYTVSLVITTTAGCTDTLIRDHYIQVNGPSASFTSPVTLSCSASSVTFVDNSTDDGLHPIVQWTWNYGDGIIETLSSAPFSHTYAAGGVYGVTLTVMDTEGCTDVLTLPAAITISSPVAIFRTADTITCANANVRFTNTSTGTNLTYLWQFGDGGTSTIRNANYAYPADGIYTVKLMITDRYGCKDSATKVNYIKVFSPVALFAASDTFGTCPPLVVNFTNNSVNYTSLQWDFGDGTGSTVPNPSHFYSQPGTYIASLTVRKLTCVSVMQKTIVVQGPTGSFTYNNTIGCQPLTVNFVGTTVGRISFIWDFSDGTTIPTTDSVISHVYTIAGTYVPRMILVDATGCVVPVAGRDTIYVKDAKADFRVNSNLLCNPGMLQFTDTSWATEPITNYQWNFGDGTTSNVQNPGHAYLQTGLYYPSLTITTAGGCTNVKTSQTPIKVINTPRGSITRTPDGCVPLTARFSGTVLNPDTSAITWNWNFGNGNFSNSQNPPDELYQAAGNYTIRLYVTNSSGCADTLSTQLNAYALPNVDAGVDTAMCAGSSIRLQASGAAGYSWSPSTGLSCSNCPDPVASPGSYIRYYLTGTSAEGCVKRDSVEVKVWQNFSLRVSDKDTMCAGSSRQLNAFGAAQYRWEPATGLNNPNIANPVASPSTTTIYTVTGTDAHRCFTHTATVPIKVYPIPVVEAGENKTINVGQSIDLTPSISTDVREAIWSPTGSIFRNDFPSVTVKPRETTTYLVKVVNEGGCVSEDLVTVNVICNNANVFIPNTFSPNNDGANDIFYPRGSGLFRIKSMKVFSRWGEVVFEKNDFAPNDSRAGWDGSFRGKPLSADVYVYMIEIMCDNNTVLPLKGNVTLLK